MRFRTTTQQIQNYKGIEPLESKKDNIIGSFQHHLHEIFFIHFKNIKLKIWDLETIKVCPSGKNHIILLVIKDNLTLWMLSTFNMYSVATYSVAPSYMVVQKFYQYFKIIY